MTVNISDTNHPLIPHQMQLLMREHQKAINSDALELQNVPKMWEEAHFPIPNTIKINLFAAICAEPFIIDTEWEGDQFENPIRYLVNFFEEHPQNSEGRWKDQTALLKEMELIATQLTQMQSSENIQEEQFELAEKLQKKLQDEGEVWFPGGWTTQSGGHALVIHATKEGTVTIINSGAGTHEYHHEVNQTHLDPLTNQCVETYKVQQFLRIKNCRLDRLLHKDFFLALIELKTSAFRNEKAATPGAAHLYEGVINFLEGEIEPSKNPEKHPELYFVPQVAGTCTMSCLTATLYYHFLGLFDHDAQIDQSKIKEFKKRQIEWQFSALIAMLKDSSSKPLSPDEHLLLEDVGEYLARQVALLHKEGILEENEISLMQLTLREIEKRVATYKQTSQKNALQPIFIECSGTATVFKTSLEMCPDLLLKNVDQPSGSVSSDANRTSPFIKLDPQLLQDPTRALNHYKHLLKPLHDAKDQDKTNFRKLIEIVCHLPIPTREEDKFWNCVPEEQILPWMEELINSFAFIEKVQKHRNDHIDIATAEELVVMHTFLAIVDKLARRKKENRLTGFQVCCIELLTHVKIPEFQLKHPKMQHILHQILLYFDPNHRLENTTQTFDPISRKTMFDSLFSFCSIDYKNRFAKGTINLSKRSFRENATVRFFQQFTKPQEFNENYIRKIGAMIADNTGAHPTIPKEIFFLKQATLLCLKRSSRIEGPIEIDLRSPAPPYDPNTYVRVNNLGFHSFNLHSSLMRRSPCSTIQNQNELMGSIADTKRDNHFSGLGEAIKQQFEQLPQDLYLRFQMIHQDPYDEVNRALTLFQSELRQLKRLLKEWFPAYFFRPGRLASQLKDDPKFGRSIETQLSKMRDRLIDLDDFENLVPLIQLHQELALFVKLEPWFPTIWPLIKILRSTDLDRSIQLIRAFFGGFLAVQMKDFDQQPEYWMTFLKSLGCFFYPSKLQKQTSDYKSYHSLLDNFWQLIAEKFDEDPKKRDEVLQVHLHLNFPEADTQQWTGTFPKYTSHEFEVDYENFTIRKVGEGISTVINRRLMSDLLDFRLTPEQISTVILMDDGSVVINQNQPDALICRENVCIPNTGAKSYSFFRNFSSLNVEDPSEHQYQCALLPIINDRFSFRQIFPNSTHEWFATHAGVENVIITQDEKILSRVTNGTLTRESDGATLNFGSDRWSNDEPSPFKHIEKNQNEIFLWEKEGKIVEVEFPKHELTLLFDTKKGFVLKEAPHLTLVRPKDLPELRHCKSSLWLKDSHGKHLVWVSSFATNRETKHRKIDRWAEFSYENGQLKTDELWCMLLLCSLYAKAGNYQKAHQVLEKAQDLKRLNRNEIWAFNDLEGILCNREHPMAIALRLRLVLFRERNNLLYPLSIGEGRAVPYDQNTIQGLLEKYYKLHSHCPALHLNEQEELALLKIFERLVFEKRDNESSFSPNYRMELQFKRTLFNQIVQPRIDLLELGRAHLGYKKIPNFTKLRTISKTHVKINVEASKDGICIDPPKEISSALFQPKDYFSECFGYFYLIAKKGSPDERERLLHRLQLISWAPDVFEVIPILIDVTNNPSSFPELEHFNGEISSEISSLSEGKTELVTITIPRWKATLIGTIKTVTGLVHDVFQFGQFAVSSGKVPYEKPLSSRKFAPLFEAESCELVSIDNAYDKYFQGIYREYFEALQGKDDHLKSEKTLAQLKKNLVAQITYLRPAINSEKVALLWLCNRTHTVQEWFLLKGLQRRMNFRDLQKWVLSREIRENLNEEEVKRALFGVACILIQETRLGQMEAIVSQIDQWNEANQNFVIENCGKMLTQIRAYVASEKELPKLWFEYANHYLYRQIQIKKWKAITPKQMGEMLAEMHTGFGKTKTITASINEQKLREGTPVLNICPGSLEHVNASDTQIQMDASYCQNVRRLYFDRATNFTTDSLKMLWEEVQKPQPIILRSETLRALQLHFQLSLLQAQDKYSNDLSEQIELLWKILRYFKLRSFATIDEGHQTLHPMDRLIYTHGGPTQVPKEEVEVFEALFLTILEKFPKFDLRNNRQTYFSDDAYDALVKVLTEEFAVKWKLTEAQIDAYYHYCNGDITMPEWVDSHPNKEKLCLLKGILSYILPESRKGHVDEHYGLSKKHQNRTEFAIPYKSANTPKETEKCPSQFQNPHETIVKTYFLYLYKGLSSNQIKTLILHLEQVVDLYQGEDVTESEAYVLLHTLIPGTKKEREKKLEQGLDALASMHQLHQEAIFYYIHHIVIPQIKIYPEMLISTVQNLRDQIHSSLTFTATPQHPKAHGPHTEFVPMVGAKEKVDHLLLSQCAGKDTLHSVPVGSPKDMLESTIQLILKKKYQSVIDTGALFKGISSLDVAKNFGQAFSQEVPTRIKGIVFYNEDSEQFCILSVGDDQIHEYRNHTYKLDQLFVYLDQSRSVGSDIPLPINAVALMLVNCSTTMDSARQGAGRPRQLGRGQRLEILYTEDMDESPSSNDDNELTIGDLISQFNTNSVAEDAVTNYQSQPLQMDNELHSVAMGKLLNLNAGIDAKPHVASIVKTFRQFQDLFLFQSKKHPSELYGTLPKEVGAKKALQDHVRIAKNRVESLKALSGDEKQSLCQKLDAYESQWDQLSLPKKVKVGTSLGLECEVLQEVEVETQVQVNAQVQKDHNKGFRAIRLWSDSLNLFQPGWERPHSIRSATTKILEIIQKLGRLIDSLSPEKPLATKAMTISSCVTTANIMILGGGVLGWTTAIITNIALAALFLYSQNRINKNPIPRVHGCAVWKLSDVMQHHFPKTNMGAFFSPNLLVSNNFSVQETYRYHEIRQTPFTDQQKALVQVLVIQDENKKVQMMLIDQNDSTYFRRRLQEDRDIPVAADAVKRTRKIAIYDLKTNDLKPSLISQGKNPFDKDELEDNPQFQALLAEAKFFAAEIKYTTVQKEHLRARAQATGLNNTLSFFQDNILPQRPIHASAFDKDQNFLIQT